MLPTVAAEALGIEQRREVFDTRADGVEDLRGGRAAEPVHPSLLFGSGIPLFGDRPYRPERFDAVETVAHDSGVVFTELVRRATP